MLSYIFIFDADKNPLLGNGYSQPNPLNAMQMMGFSPAHAAAAAASLSTGGHVVGHHHPGHAGMLMTPGGFPVPVSSHALSQQQQRNADRLFSTHSRSVINNTFFILHNTFLIPYNIHGAQLIFLMATNMRNGTGN
jgi:hypothetical protein